MIALGFKNMVKVGFGLRQFSRVEITKSSGIISRCLPSLNVLNIGDKCFKSTSSKKGKGKKKGPQKSIIVNLDYYTHDENIDEKKGNTPIIIMHGLMGSKSNWSSMSKALNMKIGRKVYAVDTRNHGESPHTDEFSYELMVSDLLAFMTTHHISKASFIGHSLGGRVAMLLSLMYPEVVKSLVVVDISPIGASPNLLGIKQILKVLKTLDVDEAYTLPEARKQAAIELKERIKDKRVVDFLLTNLVDNDFGSPWRWRFNLDSLYENFEKELVHFPILSGPYEGRTLFLAGSESDYLKPKDEPYIKELFPAAEFTYIEGCGHWVHSEKPAEFLTIVSEFMNNDTP